MGKKKHFDKQRSIVFKLIPAVDKNNQSRIMFQAVVPKKCKLSEKQKQQIIKQFSNEHQFEAKNLPQRDDRFAGIPPEILEKIRGRTDLVINGRSATKGNQIDLDDEDFGEDVDEEKMMENIQEYDEFLIEEGEDDEDDYNQEEEKKELKHGGDEIIDDESWETDEDGDQQFDEEEQIQEQIQQTKQPKQVKPSPQNFDDDFPQLPEPGTAPAIIQQDEKQIAKLSKKQQQILNNVLPSNYESFKISNAQMKMFDADGNPIDGYDYSQHFSTGKAQAIAKFQVEFIAPTLPDVDIEEQKMPAAGKQVDQALQKAEIYEQLQDDFFIKLMKLDNVKVQQKQTKKPKKVQSKPKVQSNIKQLSKQKEQPEEEQFTEQQLFKMMNEMRNNTVSKKQTSKDKNQVDDNDDNDADYQDIDDDQDFQDDLQGQQLQDQQLGQEQQEEDQRQFHELSKKQKRIFMKNYKIPEVEDLAKEELKIKMKTFKGAKPQQIHLKKIHQKVPFDKDIAMQNTMNKGSDTSDIQTMSQASDGDDDIVSYHTKHSTVSSSVNFIIEQSKNKNKKQKSGQTKPETRPQISKPEHPISQKRDKNQTKQQKKLRKQQLKDFKKDKRESKKQFMEELKVQKKIVNNNTKAALHGVGHVSIL